MSSTDELLERNKRYAAGPKKVGLASRPARRVAVVACMDARLDPVRVLGLEDGDAHVIRNAGGAVSDDVIRSLTVSQRLLGTDEVVLIQHTDCGMLGLADGQLKAEIERETGLRPAFSFEGFHDLDGEIRQNLARIAACPFLPEKGSVRGFVYDVDTGALREVVR